MPCLHLSVGRPVDANTRRFLARYLTALVADLLRKRPEVAAVHATPIVCTGALPRPPTRPNESSMRYFVDDDILGPHAKK